MPLTTGAVTCRPYFIETPPKPDFLNAAARDLKRHAFKPVNVERSPRSIGWVNPHNLLDADVVPAKIVFDDYLVMGLRVDKIAVNARILKAHVGETIREVLRERNVKQLSRDQRTTIVEKVRMDLMKQQTPATSLYEVAWNLETHHVYFSATGESLNDEFRDLFEDTFHVTVLPLFPYLRAERKARAEGLQEELLQTNPARLHP